MTVVGLSGVSQNAFEIQMRGAGQLQGKGYTFLTLWIHAGAMISTVDLEKYGKANTLASGAFLEFVEGVPVIQEKVQ